jgi:glutamate dehydrogenase/leucine dehydrogenase
MEPIRYRPGEAIRWLEIGADDIRKSAKRQGTSLVRREGGRTIGKDLRDAAGAIFGLGKSALADLLHRQAEAAEVVLNQDSFTVNSPGGAKTVQYADVTAMKMQGDRLTVEHENGRLTIKPYAYIVSGRVKVPVGWSRNGLEVPYDVLLDELSARCKTDIERV